ncbi:MAG TPA: DUF1697 domain-containing protein [Candidatus Bathyarchaeia archaeon]|nr:DUF1697 domain-containing protein [Candidatus Bathyarchaeia archaeon]
MPKYVAFLRGINVGGKNIVKKEMLQEAFASLGYQHVSVWRQSGNIIFETDKTDLEQIKTAIQKKLKSLLDSKIVVILRSLSYLEELVENKPFGNMDEEGTSYLVTFLSAETAESTIPLKIPNSTAEIIRIGKYEAYSVTHGHGEGGQPNPFLEKKLKTQATTRNWNTIKEIVEAYSK